MRVLCLIITILFSTQITYASFEKATLNELDSNLQKISWFYDYRAEKSTGNQVAFLATVSAEDIYGLQLSIFANLANANMGGSQFSFGTNIVNGHMNGHQFFAPVQYATRMNGSQIFGFINRAREIDGWQIGDINIADTINGVQLGGLNIANNVQGSQFGFINIADSISSHSLALFTLTRNGLFHMDYTLEDNGMSVLNFTTGKKFFTTYSVGYHIESRKHPYRFGFGIGYHIDVNPVFLEALWQTSLLVDEDTKLSNADKRSHLWRQNYFTQLKAKVGFKIGKYAGVFAGASYNFLETGNDGMLIKPKYTSNLKSDKDWYYWPGFEAGIRIGM